MPQRSASSAYFITQHHNGRSLCQPINRGRKNVPPLSGIRPILKKPHKGMQIARPVQYHSTGHVSTCALQPHRLQRLLPVFSTHVFFTTIGIVMLWKYLVEAFSGASGAVISARSRPALELCRVSCNVYTTDIFDAAHSSSFSCNCNAISRLRIEFFPRFSVMTAIFSRGEIKLRTLQPFLFSDI